MYSWVSGDNVRVEIHTKPQPLVVNESQVQKLAELLATSGPTKIGLFGIGRMAVLDSLQPAFASAKWQVVRSNTGMYAYGGPGPDISYGVHIVNKAGESPAGIALRSALASIGVGVEEAPWRASFDPETADLWLVVGNPD